MPLRVSMAMQEPPSLLPLLAAEKAEDGSEVGVRLSSLFSFLTSPSGWAADKLKAHT